MENWLRKKEKCICLFAVQWSTTIRLCNLISVLYFKQKQDDSFFVSSSSDRASRTGSMRCSHVWTELFPCQTRAGAFHIDKSSSKVSHFKIQLKNLLGKRANELITIKWKGKTWFRFSRTFVCFELASNKLRALKYLISFQFQMMLLDYTLKPFFYTHIEYPISSHLQALLKVTCDCMLCMTNTFQHLNDLI